MLRIDEKIFPSWAFFDDSLDTPSLFSLYSALWFGSYFGWELTQADLAHMGKMSLRSAQDNLKLLEQRGFIASRRQDDEFFWSCAGYPDCKYTLPDDHGKPANACRRS